MPIIIREIVSEVVLEGTTAEAAPSGPAAEGRGPAGEVDMDQIVSRATERVLEVLRREWDR